MDSAIDSLVKSLPITGPIIVAMGFAIYVLWKAHRDAMSARVVDAQETAKTLVAVNTSTTQALTGLTTAITALKESNDETQATLREVREALPRRTR